jgi:Type IV secretion-system coupling protein DNA-binding domain
MKPTNSSNQQSLILYLILIPSLLLALWVVQNPDVALPLMEQPILILPYLVEKFGLLKVVAYTVATISCFWFFLIYANGHQNSNVQRGAQVVSARKLKALLKKQPRSKNQPQLTIAGMPIPKEYETLGFFIFGSPGSGKTQAISQMVGVLKQRTDFRGMVFDRNGEMLEKFYDPQRDLIFNPFDARSVHWSHVHEAARPETMAAGLIPQESAREPFFSNAGRAVIAELFRLTKSNQELWELLKSDNQTLSSFLSGTLAARYLAEERTATSVLSTVSNYCQFYPYLTQPRNKALSFYDWAANSSPRWVFVTLRENDSELLKPLHSLIFELMLNGLLSKEERSIKTAVVIDELGALNQLPSLNRLLSESRKDGGCPILGTQTEAQITKIYGQEDTRIILQGTKTKLILNCADPQTAETMSKIIGRQELLDTTENQSRSHHSGRTGSGSSVSFNQQFREVSAVMPSQLQDLPKLKGYLKLASLPAALVKLKVNKLVTRARRFVPLQDSSPKQQGIDEQWSDFQS